jgi:Carboxypeptidase regulatory-like domain
MHVTADPLLIELPVGEPATIAVSITNTSSMIDAYDVDAFGLDPSWTTVSPARLSLFPSEIGIVEIGVTLPPDVPAGSRTIAVHVRSENDRNEFALAQVSLDVGARSRTSLRVDPVLVTGGSKAEYSLIIANEGNATVEARPHGEDPEDLLEITFEPPIVVLPPGRREIVHATARGGRRWFGQPKPRLITFTLGPDAPPSMATFVQRPRIGRWLLSLLGLVTAAAVFAMVLTTVADRLVDKASVDPRVLDKALDQQNGAGAAGMASVQPSAVTGKVVVTSTGQGIAGVSVGLYGSGNGTVTVKTAATDGTGAFTFNRVPVGRYRVKVSGAGFAAQWYQGSLTFADAKDIDVDKGATVTLQDIKIGGQPGSVEGEVVADDPTGATARLVVPGVADANTSALVQETTVGADGKFRFEDVPAPANYQLIVGKEGFASEVRDVQLAAAQALDGIKVVLSMGDGTVAGHVQSPSGPLGGVAIVATSGDLAVPTVSLTVDDVGAFTLRDLPTPGTYTVTFAKEGYQSATRTADLQAAQQVGGLDVTMAPTIGSISGTVHDANGPLGGVNVSITGPDKLELSTTSASVGQVGQYTFEALPSPGSYTLTFTKDGYVAQTLLKSLGGASGASALTGVDATLVSSTATVRGTVQSSSGKQVAGASVSLSDGSVTKQFVSADNGRFEFGTVKPGAYTLTATLPGTSPAVQLVNVIANDVVDVTLTLQAQASLSGLVQRVNPQTGAVTPYAGANVRLYPAAVFPAPPSQALFSVTTGADGSYTFSALDAPADFVVAVYAAPTSGDALDSVLVQSQPSTAEQVPTFLIRTGTATTTTVATTTTIAPTTTVASTTTTSSSSTSSSSSSTSAG